MGKQKRKSNAKWKIGVSLYLVIILFSLLTVASYTWFSLSRTPRVSDLYMFVNTQTGLELSLDPGAEEWELQLDFRDMVDVTAPLRPVTWSDLNQRFYAAVYGLDGRMTGQWEPLTDERNANKENLDGYYIKAAFYARSGQAVTAALSPAVEVSEGTQGSGTFLIGYPEWDSVNIVHNNGGKGGECAVRVGIRTTPVDSTGSPIGEPSGMIIYEPNSDVHIGGAVGYIPTRSLDGTPTLVDESRLILQTSSSWTEADPVQRGVVMQDLGEFTTDTKVFSLLAGEILRVDLYVWLEGQDVDCTNTITQAQILASIQFTTSAEDQSGMVPIEPLEPNEKNADHSALDRNERHGDEHREEPRGEHDMRPPSQP